MELTDREKGIFEQLDEMEIVDCHEHLGPETWRVGSEVDVFTLFAHYTYGDLMVAGMKQEEYDSLSNRAIPLERRWRTFAPYWEQIRWGSYARAALLAARYFYGFDDINEDTYVPISEAAREANRPGIYDRVLREACNIRVALTQCGSTDLDSPLLKPVMPMCHEMGTWESLADPPFDREARVRSLDDYLDALTAYIVRVKSEGAVGLKMVSNPYQPPDRGAALSAFERLRTGTGDPVPGSNPLMDYVVDHAISVAERHDLVVCVHTGYWGDFRQLDPLHMIPLLQRHPQARFDIYHLGYPWVRECLMLGKGFPNVWLNFCWTHIISQRFATDALDESIDLVPANKVLAFGGDYGTPVEKVYGHLVMAKEDVARVLARRVSEGQMTEAQALALAEKWFAKNPAELYRLEI